MFYSGYKHPPTIRYIKLPDPHDRIIVATAKLLNATLITKDEKIKNSKIVKTIW